MGYNVYSEDRSRVYVDLGTYFIFPNAKFTQQKTVQGVTSTIGLELFILTIQKFQVCYYLSGGFGHIRAYADNLENKPRYGNGVIFNNGFRFYLSK